MAVMGAEARVERAADMARLYVRELADLEASPEADRAAAALAVDLGAPEAQVRAILSLPETIRPVPGGADRPCDAPCLQGETA